MLGPKYTNPFSVPCTRLCNNVVNSYFEGWLVYTLQQLGGGEAIERERQLEEMEGFFFLFDVATSIRNSLQRNM